MTKVHVVMVENSQADFKYLVGVFSTGSKAEAAAEYEIARRRANSLPGKYTPKIFKVEVDLMGVPLSVNALEELKNRR